MPTPEVEAAKEFAKAASPFSGSAVIPTLWMIGVAMIGGAVSFYSKVKAGKARAANIPELIGELFVSGAVGAFTYWLLQGLDVNPYLQAAGVGISGHMGSRAIYLAEQYIEKKLGLDADPDATAPGIKPNGR